MADTPDSPEKPPAGYAFQQCINLADALELPPGEREALLFRRPESRVSQRIMDFAEKQVQKLPVEKRAEVLKTLLRDVMVRFDLERDTPGISADDAREKVLGIMKGAEELMKEMIVLRAAEGNAWAEKEDERKRTRHTHKSPEK